MTSHCGKTKTKPPNLAYLGLVWSGTCVSVQAPYETTSFFSGLQPDALGLLCLKCTSLPTTQSLCSLSPLPTSLPSALFQFLFLLQPSVQASFPSQNLPWSSAAYSAPVSFFCKKLLWVKNYACFCISLNHHCLAQCLMYNSCWVNMCGNKERKEGNKQNNRVPIWNLGMHSST